MKKLTILFILGALLCAMLSACGKDNAPLQDTIPFRSPGNFSFKSTAPNYSEGDKEYPVELTGNITIREEIENGIKTVTAVITVNNHQFDNGDIGLYLNWGFLDTYSETAYSYWENPDVTHTVNYNDKDYMFSVHFEEFWGYPTFEPNYNIITVTCPEDYDGAAFFVCGIDTSLTNTYDKFVHYSEIAHGKYDFLIFKASPSTTSTPSPYQ